VSEHHKACELCVTPKAPSAKKPSSCRRQQLDTRSKNKKQRSFVLVFLLCSYRLQDKFIFGCVIITRVNSQTERARGNSRESTIQNADFQAHDLHCCSQQPGDAQTYGSAQTK
jgi:hypothetical protein